MRLCELEANIKCGKEKRLINIELGNRTGRVIKRMQTERVTTSDQDANKQDRIYVTAHAL